MVLKHKTLFTSIALAILVIFGSFVTFYTTNFWMHDLANNFYGVQDAGAIISFGTFVFSLDFVLVTIFLIRIYRRPEYKKALIKLYSLILLIFSTLGLICNILTGTVMYGSFTTPYPFPGCTILSLICNLLLLVGAGLVRFYFVNKLEDDKEKRKFKGSYIAYSFMMAIMIYFAFNRFGALLWSPVYVQIRTLNLSWPFYLYLALPLSWIAIIVIRAFDRNKKSIKVSFVIAISSLVLNIVLSIVIFAIAAKHTEFISAISPALGLERLATAPISTIVQSIAGLIFTGYEVFYTVKMIIKHK